MRGAVLPTWLGNIIGFKASIANSNAGTWTSPPMLVNPDDPTATCIKLLPVDSADVVKALYVVRKHGPELTAITHQLIIRALDKAIPDPTFKNWLSHTAINMRPAVRASNGKMGLVVTGHSQSHPRVGSLLPFSEEDWAAARSMTEKLAGSATVTEDPPTRLLRYIPRILGKIGHQREGRTTSAIWVYFPMCGAI
jgi:hypothetical protein